MKNIGFKNIKTIALLLLVVVLGSGCFSSKKAPIVSLPNWYLNNPANTDTFIYGVGEGSSLEDAKTSALNSMSSRLVVAVGSSLEKLTTSDSSGGYSKQVTQDIKVDVEKIQFTNAKVEKNAIVGGTFYVLMSVNRLELFNEKTKSFNIEDKSIDTAFSEGKSLSKLERIYQIQNMTQKIVNNRKKAFVLYAINNTFDYGIYFSKYDGFLSEIDKLKSELQISVSSNDQNKFFADELIEALNDGGYKVVNNSSDVKIKLQNKIRYSEYKSWIIAKVSTTVAVNSNGKTVSNRIVKANGRSTSSQANALQSAANNFRSVLEKDGLDSFLFGR